MTSILVRVYWTGFLVVAFGLAFSVSAQTPPAQNAAPKINAAATIPIVSIEGKDNFDAYCAVCHGIDGKGHGPAAPAMKVAVPDLTTIAIRHSGKFDAIHVENIVKGNGKMATPAHGVETMPIWGDVFRFEDRPRATLRIQNLVGYVRSLQVSGTSE
jgi:mono/diheme cytochrome c family protein